MIGVHVTVKVLPKGHNRHIYFHYKWVSQVRVCRNWGYGEGSLELVKNKLDFK